MSLRPYHERSSSPNDKIIRLLSCCSSKMCLFAAAKSHQAMMIQGLVAQARQVFSKMLTCRSLKIITRNMHSISRRWGFHIQPSSAILITEQAMVDENRPTPAGELSGKARVWRCDPQPSLCTRFRSQNPGPLRQTRWQDDHC